MRTGNPSLGQQTGVLQLLHPLPAELPTQGVVNPGRPAEPHQPRPPQRGAERVERRRPFLPDGSHRLVPQLSPHEGVNYLMTSTPSCLLGMWLKRHKWAWTTTWPHAVRERREKKSLLSEKRGASRDFRSAEPLLLFYRRQDDTGELWPELWSVALTGNPPLTDEKFVVSIITLFKPLSALFPALPSELLL